MDSESLRKSAREWLELTGFFHAHRYEDRLVVWASSLVAGARREAFIEFNDAMNDFSEEMKTDPTAARAKMKARMLAALGAVGESR